MRKHCPRCKRATHWLSRSGLPGRQRPADLPPGVVLAAVSDGTCTTCWRILKGKPRLITKGTTTKREIIYRHTLTDAEVEAARVELLKLFADRRRRGIHPEGQDPEVLHRPGLSLLEV